MKKRFMAIFIETKIKVIIEIKVKSVQLNYSSFKSKWLHE